MDKRKYGNKFRSNFFLLSTVTLFILTVLVFYFHNKSNLFRLKTWEPYLPLDLSTTTTKTTTDTGSATSGKIFQGLKIRTFPRHEIKFSEDSAILMKRKKAVPTNRPNWAHQRPECKKWSVTTTINEVTEAVRHQLTLPPDWCMVIVGDRKGPGNYPLNEGKKGRVIYLNVQDQEQLAAEGVTLSKTLPWNHFGRKNLGYIYAIASGAELIWDFNDDNRLLSTPAKIMEPSEMSQLSETSNILRAKIKNNKTVCNSFNPLPLMSSQQKPFWPRGLPLLDIKAPECQPEAYQLERTTVLKNKIAVYQSLANNDPDADAIYRFTQTLPFDFTVQDKTSVLVPDKAFAPLNSQATLFTYKAFFMLFLPVTVHRRVSDIWRSFFGEKLLKESGFEIVFTYPQVSQNRNVNNDLFVFDAERDLYFKSGKLVEFLKYNLSSNCKCSLECEIESMFISLYEHGYIEISDVYYIQTWIRSLLDYGYKFSQLEEKQECLHQSPAPLNQPALDEQKWPDLVLFVPVFPGGEAELNNVFLRSLKFFWPKSFLKLLFLVDEEIPLVTRDPFVERIKKSMEPNAKSVEVKFNFIPFDVHKAGHNRQQLIMLWADNFTDAEYVGFLDDDALITNHVLLEDVFDEKGRPHVWGRSNKPKEKFWHKVGVTTSWTDNSDVEIMRTMNYFPVVVKTNHLKEIRANVLKHRPEFKNFDSFFQHGLVEKWKCFYSQFNLMHQHLWKLKNDEYNWHLEAISAQDDHFRKISGVADEMTFPKPRSSLHFNYDDRRGRPKFIEDVLKRGFCYSLTKSEFEANGENSQRCKKAGYSWEVVSITPNLDQWIFERLNWQWDPRHVEAHKKRILLNRARTDWNEEELKKIFT